MDSRHLVDPELLPATEMFGSVALAADNLQQMRATEWPPVAVVDDGLVHEVVVIPGPDGAPDIGLHILRPAQAKGPLPLIYHMHGGGYVLGTAEQFVTRSRTMVAELGCAFASVDYRLAPETPFPGAIEDCYAGLAWLFDNAADLGFDPKRIGVMGESAGGGLAAALALLARDRGDYKLAFQHLIYPMLDDRTSVSSEPHGYAGQFFWTAASNRFGWQCLLGEEPGGTATSPYAAAARATDLSGLPPTFIYAAALDLLLEENIEYARRLARAGVPIELHVFPGAFHAFEIQDEAQVTIQAKQISHAALKRFLAPKEQDEAT